MTNTTDQTNQTKQSNNTQSTEGGRNPDMIGYIVQDRGSEKSAIWTQIGAAWAHKDGKGYELRLQSLPVDGHLTLRFKDTTSCSPSAFMRQRFDFS